MLTWPFRWSWRNRKWVALVTGSLVLIAVATLLIVNPNGMVWGYLLGEKFHYGRPTNYWRKQFAAGWDDDTQGRRASARFLDFDSDGSPVLCDLLVDPDVNVRRVAAATLQIQGLNKPETVGPLATALTDADPWVRGLAAEAIGRRGELAREHFSTLVKLTDDPDPKVSGRAEAGAWGMDGDRMAERAGWVTYRSERGRYSARFPVRPKVSETVAENDGWRVRYERAEVNTADAVFVIEYTDDTLAEPKVEGEGSRWDRTVPIVKEYVSAANLSGHGELLKGEGGDTGLVMEFSGTDADGHPVEYLTVSRSAVDLANEGEWTVMAIDRTAKKRSAPVALAKMRYFLGSFKPDLRPKAK